MYKLHAITAIALTLAASHAFAADYTHFPDGSSVPQWFQQANPTDISTLGKQFIVTDFGVKQDSTIIQTEALQEVIDLAYANGGGVVVIPEGVYLSGSLFFKPGTHLHVKAGGKLKGIDSITHYQIIKTRLEGQSIDYFAALINADACNGFTITGQGTIDGNGRRFYDEFWLRRKVNPKCTNLEALRPRLIYISNSNDIEVSGVNLTNAGFWTNHLYCCNRVKYIGCNITAPTEGYPKGPSTDAIDLDVCSDVLIDGCYMDVNDDAVCLKGGKGTYVDTIPGNGGVQRIVIRNCSFGRTNAGVTFGSEAWDCSNVILHDCKFNETSHVVLFKMRPDTPQQYRNILVDNVSGKVRNGMEVQRWTQFYNKVERDPMPPSGVSNVVMKNANLNCTREFYREAAADYFSLDNFTFENIQAFAPDTNFTPTISNLSITNVKVKSSNEGPDNSPTIDDFAN